MPSTIDSPRSTSPPKSAWPGVSMMLIVIGVRRPRRAGVADRGVLGEDRDALLALEVAGVHRPLVDVLGWCAERAGLPQHRVDERGLAVVDVGDDRDVAQVGTGEGMGGGVAFAGWGFEPRSYRRRCGGAARRVGRPSGAIGRGRQRRRRCRRRTGPASGTATRTRRRGPGPAGARARCRERGSRVSWPCCVASRRRRSYGEPR